MADYMELYSNTATTFFDQSVIYYQHHHHHPLDICLFEKKLDLPILTPYILMDDHSSSQAKIITTSDTALPTAKTSKKRRRNGPLLQNKKRIGQNHHPIAASTSQGKDIIQLQNTLDYLQDEWAIIDIVLSSLKSAFTVYPSKMTTEEYLDEIDRELSIAYDDLMAQVRSLDRNLKRLDTKIKSCYTTGPLV